MTEIFEVMNSVIEHERMKANDKNTNEQEPEQKKRGRPRKTDDPKPQEEPKGPKKSGRPLALWRHREDGTYNDKSIDPEYANKYWRTHYRKPYTCGICGGTINCIGAIKRHERTMHCQLAKLKKEKETN